MESIKIRLKEAYELIENIESIKIEDWDYNDGDYAQLNRTLLDIRKMSVKTVEKLKEKKWKDRLKKLKK